MRHYPAFCTDCHRLWLVATAESPSSSPVCPRCHERGRLVPGAYYSDPASLIFTQLEAAIDAKDLSATELGRMSSQLEELLPTPNEGEIEQAYLALMQQLGLVVSTAPATGRRVGLRMAVTIANTLSQPVTRESGVMRLPQTIRGLFDAVQPERVRERED